MSSRLQDACPVTDSRGPGPLAQVGQATLAADRGMAGSRSLGWTEACRPAQRLKRGGAASHLAPVSQVDIANRYGLYLDFLQRNGRLDPAKGASPLSRPTT